MHMFQFEVVQYVSVSDISPDRDPHLAQTDGAVVAACFNQ